jgi:SAM-dependent methyltransferase
MNLSKILGVLSSINLMAEPVLRRAWVIARALYFIRVRGRLRTADSQQAVRANVSHNLKGIYSANCRMNLLLYPLAIIETLDRNARILVIGPRNEFDLFTLVGLGFKLENLRGLDLISYSPLIELGDMHAMRFDDASFDAVVCGWTLSYSIDPRRAASEMTRIVRAGGVIAVGVEYSSISPDEEKQLLGYQLQELEKIGARVNSTAALRALFGPSVGHVYFEHDAPRKRAHGADGMITDVSNVALVFSRTA